MKKLLDLTMVFLSLTVFVLVLILFWTSTRKLEPEIYFFVDVVMPEIIVEEEDPRKWEIYNPPVAPRPAIRKIKSY